MDLAQLVRTRREARGWTQEELAEKIGRDQNFISSIEIGRTRRPKSQNLRALMEILDIPADLMAAAVGMRALQDTGIPIRGDVDPDDPYLQLLTTLASTMDEHERETRVSVAQLIVRNRGVGS